MELFKYIDRDGYVNVVSAKEYEGKRPWGLAVNGESLKYYDREQDAKAAGTRMKKSINRSGQLVIDSEAVSITQEFWDSIPGEFKGVWEDVWGDKPEWLGRKTMTSSTLYTDTDKCRAVKGLLIEGIDFYIEK